jgi:hypothetical protein
MQGVELSTTAYIHRGVAYDVAGYTTIAGDGTYVFLGKTGAFPVHLHDFSVKTDVGNVLIELIENPAVSDAGTPATSYNRNRSSARQSRTKVYAGATISGGTTISTRKIHDIGGGAHEEGGADGFAGEWVLKPLTTYAIKITNLNAISDVNISASFFYYEIEL